MNREISLKSFLMVLTILIIIEVFILVYLIPHLNYKKHCSLAVCNDDDSICYNYEADSLGKTHITWSGTCKK